MSESTGPETGTFAPDYKTGSAGKPIPGTELKIDRPDAGMDYFLSHSFTYNLLEGNGEVCWRGRNVFMGYMKNPQASSETIDEEGYSSI